MDDDFIRRECPEGERTRSEKESKPASFLAHPCATAPPSSRDNPRLHRMMTDRDARAERRSAKAAENVTTLAVCKEDVLGQFEGMPGVFKLIKSERVKEQLIAVLEAHLASNAREADRVDNKEQRKQDLRKANAIAQGQTEEQATEQAARLKLEEAERKAAVLEEDAKAAREEFEKATKAREVAEAKQKEMELQKKEYEATMTRTQTAEIERIRQEMRDEFEKKRSRDDDDAPKETKKKRRTLEEKLESKEITQAQYDKAQEEKEKKLRKKLQEQETKLDNAKKLQTEMKTTKALKDLLLDHGVTQEEIDQTVLAVQADPNLDELH